MKTPTYSYDPAHPVLTQSASLQNETSLGLTKREYFAAMAMQSFIVANPHSPDDKNAAESVAMADALITALNKEEQ